MKRLHNLITELSDDYLDEDANESLNEAIEQFDEKVRIDKDGVQVDVFCLEDNTEESAKNFIEIINSDIPNYLLDYWKKHSSCLSNLSSFEYKFDKRNCFVVELSKEDTIRKHYQSESTFTMIYVCDVEEDSKTKIVFWDAEDLHGIKLKKNSLLMFPSGITFPWQITCQDDSIRFIQFEVDRM